MNTNEKMKKRKIKAVIRYHRPNKRKEPELYFHHLLMLYYPWRNENDLLGNEQTFASKFDEPGVQAIVQQHRSIFEPDAEAVTEALEWLKNNEGNQLFTLMSLVIRKMQIYKMHKKSKMTLLLYQKNPSMNNYHHILVQAHKLMSKDHVQYQHIINQVKYQMTN